VGGPTEQQTNTVFIPPGEGRQAFAPSPLAWLVENMELGTDGTLESVVGPSILRIKHQIWTRANETESGEGIYRDDTTLPPLPILPDGQPEYAYKSGSPFSIYSASLLRGGAQTLLYRMGSFLYRFKGGANDEDEVLIQDLTENPESKNLDQYVTLGDTIIFFNGVDRPRVISYDGMVTPLGFDTPAGVPSISSPSQPDYDEVTNYYPNSMGYSWQGRIGTSGAELSGQNGALLRGAWYYYTQYEDIHGNLSEFSTPSDPATVHTNQAEPIAVFGVNRISGDIGGSLVGVMGNLGVTLPAKALPMGVEIDDLTRRFLVRSSGDAPEHTTAVRIYRTLDTFHKDSVPRFLARVPGAKQFAFDDNYSDSEVGSEWLETVSVPVFRTACAHKGRLVIGNVSGDPGIVRQSQPGFAGTFLKDDYIYPDSNGLEITALHSHNGNLIAFTESSIYLIGDDFMSPQPLSTGVGCVAPKSIQSMRDGSLIWLAADGFYSLNSGGAMLKLSQSIDKIFDQEINQSQLFRAVSAIDGESGEYRCAVTKKGESRNGLIMCFDTVFWRRMDYGIEIADMCSLKDHTRKTLFVGSDPREKIINSGRKWRNTSRVFIMGCQSTDYFGPPRRVRYRSAWLRSGDYGLVPTNVRSLYVGMLDSWVGKATVRLFRNGSWDPISEMHDLELCGPDDGSGIVVDVAGNAKLEKSRARHPRVFWRQIPVNIQNANSWAFEIEILGSPAPRASPVIRANPNPELVEDAVLQRWGDDFPYELAESVYSTVESLSPTKEFASWKKLFAAGEEKKALKVFRDAVKKPDDWELGRLRIHAFAFDVSIATQGTPLGRVPFRQDK